MDIGSGSLPIPIAPIRTPLKQSLLDSDISNKDLSPVMVPLSENVEKTVSGNTSQVSVSYF